MAVLVRHLALVTESAKTPKSALMEVAAALQKQAIRDLAPIWEVSATVDPFDRLDQVPTDYWPMIIRDNIERPGLAGIHEDRSGQPYALVTASTNVNRWSLTASHEMLDMLVDPGGRREVAGDSIDAAQGRVNYLVEVADPCQDADHGYPVNGVLMSDFYTPHYFDPVSAAGVRYSYTGAITAPREVLDGGYLVWRDPTDGHSYRASRFDPNLGLEIRDLGVLPSTGNTRSLVAALTPERLDAYRRGRKSVARADASRARLRNATRARADSLRTDILALERSY